MVVEFSNFIRVDVVADGFSGSNGDSSNGNEREQISIGEGGIPELFLIKSGGKVGLFNESLILKFILDDGDNVIESVEFSTSGFFDFKKSV